jgi:hypothetical protein
LDFGPPFTPERYAEALAVAEASSDLVIIDSLTHEWDGEGGILEAQEAELTRMAGEDARRREACHMAAWIKPKMRHKHLVQQVLRCKLPLICCLRAMEKTKMVRGEDGKMRVQTDEFASCIFDSRFIFEMLVNGECFEVGGRGGFLRITKVTNEDLLACLPGQGEQIDYRHGELLARWCAPRTSVDVQKPAEEPATKAVKSPSLAAVKKALWKLTEAVHQGDKQRLEQWLWDQTWLEDEERLEGLSAARLSAILGKAREHFSDVPTP